VRFLITVDGRPASQGSKGYGAAGQMIESNKRALDAWRKAIKLAAYRELQRLGIRPEALPLFPAGTPVYVTEMTFIIADDQCRAAGTDEPTGAPDIDKFLRAALDALGGGRDPRTTARILADDSQVKDFWVGPRKVRPMPGETPGAIIGLINDQEWSR
jgi:Holliday junction resolvase RusA-like endonuclease